MKSTQADEVLPWGQKQPPARQVCSQSLFKLQHSLTEEERVEHVYAIFSLVILDGLSGALFLAQSDAIFVCAAGSGGGRSRQALLHRFGLLDLISRECS